MLSGSSRKTNEKQIEGRKHERGGRTGGHTENLEGKKSLEIAKQQLQRKKKRQIRKEKKYLLLLSSSSDLLFFFL